MAFKFEQLKSSFGLFLLVFLYGLACLLIWVIGPNFGLSPAGRIVLMVLVVATWPITALIDRRQQKRQSPESEATAKLAPVGKEPRVKPTISPEVEEKAEQAVHWLKESKSGNRKAVYQLPWYVMAGPNQSGKSSLLLSSNLDFQVLPNQRPEDHYTVCPTNSCEWLVTDFAVFLDTAGRYQTPGESQNEWLGLCEILKKHRQERPLDGFVLTVNGQTIQGLSDNQLEQEAKVLRNKLDDFMTQVGMKFPVYLIFTGMDGVPGFEEFFSSFDAMERSHVWGATIPLEQSQNASALFDKEFDYLFEALMRRRLLRLSQSETPKKQLLVYEFPLRFYEIRQKLGLFTNALFRPSPFRESPLFRGFYFTSCLSQAKQQFDQPELDRSGDGEPGGEPQPNSATPQTQSVGTGYFEEEFFTEVLLRDKNLAAALKGTSTLPQYLQPSIIFGISAGLVLSLIVLINSFVQNHRLIQDLVERAQQVSQINQRQISNAEGNDDQTDTRIELEALETLRSSLEQLDGYEQNGRPVLMRFGLYSGDEIAQPARVIYFDALHQRFCRPVFKLVEQDLRGYGNPAPEKTPTTPEPNPGASNPANREEELGRQYDLLKVYLMLAQPNRVKAGFLGNQLSPYWKKTVPPDLELVAQKQLEFYVNQANRIDAPHLKAEDKLVAVSRQQLLAYPAVSRFYKRFITEIDAKVPSITMERILAGRGNDLIQGSYSVPGSFTIEGYTEYVQDGLDTAALELSKTDWVMGETSSDIRGIGADVEKLRSMYFREYTSHWQRFLKGIQVRPFQSKEEAIEGLNRLSDPESPIVVLMAEVNRQVQPSNIGFGGFVNWVKKFFTTEKKVTTTEVEREFAPLILFMSDKAGTNGTSFSQYRNALRTVADNLQGTPGDQLTQTSHSLLTGKDEIGLQKSESIVLKLTEVFFTDASKTAGKVLKQPLGNVRALLYGTSADEVTQTWGAQVYPAALKLQSGFPFTQTGAASVTDLTTFLNPQNGVFTQFFKDKLASSFDDVQGQWKLKENGAFRFSNEFVTYINQVRQLQEALFPTGGGAPEVNYEITIQPVARTRIRLDVDGTALEVQGTAPQAGKFFWPARPGTPSGAHLTVGTPTGQVLEQAFPEEWGIFKLFGSGSPVPTGQNQYKLTWKVGNVSIPATLRPSSAQNPFERVLFTQLRPPQEIIGKN